MSDDLGLALAAAREANWPGALRALLAAWRLHRAPEIAAALEAVSARAAAAKPLPIAHSDGERNKQWLERAAQADIVDLALLCASLNTTRRAHELLRRIELLLPHAPDPRIAMMVCDLLAKPTHSPAQTTLQPFWNRLWTLLTELGDPRIVARVIAFPDGWPPRDRELLTAMRTTHWNAIVAAYPDVPHVTGDQRATCEAIATCAATPTAQELADRTRDAELRAAIYANVDDANARMIYGDWLQQLGDPRGEYILLSLRRDTTAQHVKRLRALEAMFGAQWRAPIKRGELRAGFLYSSEDSDALVPDERLATLVSARSVPASDDVRVPNLRTLDINSYQVSQLAELTRPLPVERLRWNSSGDHETYAYDAFARVTVLPALRDLSLGLRRPEQIDLDDLRAIAAAPAMRSVRRLSVRFDPAGLHLVLPIVGSLALDHLELISSWRVQLRVERDDVGLGKLHLVFSTDRDVSPEILTMLATLEATCLSHVHITSVGAYSARDKLVARLREALSHQTRMTSLEIFPRR